MLRRRPLYDYQVLKNKGENQENQGQTHKIPFTKIKEDGLVKKSKEKGVK